MAARPLPRDASGLVPLAASGPLRGDPDRLAVAIADGTLPMLDSEVHGAEAGLRRYAVDLRLHVGAAAAGLTTFRKAAFLDVGRPVRVGDGWEVELGWRASTAAPLFPVFFGLLHIERGALRVEGLYAPPGGIIGRVADRMLLHVAANGTARWLLGELATESADA